MEELPAWCLLGDLHETWYLPISSPSQRTSRISPQTGGDSLSEIKMREAGVYLVGFYPVGGETKDRNAFVHPPRP